MNFKSFSDKDKNIWNKQFLKFIFVYFILAAKW